MDLISPTACLIQAGCALMRSLHVHGVQGSGSGFRGFDEVRVRSPYYGRDDHYDLRHRSDSCAGSAAARPAGQAQSQRRARDDAPLARRRSRCAGERGCRSANAHDLPRPPAFRRLRHRRAGRRLWGAGRESRGTAGREPAERRRRDGVRPQVPARAEVPSPDRARGRTAGRSASCVRARRSSGLRRIASG